MAKIELTHGVCERCKVESLLYQGKCGACHVTISEKSMIAEISRLTAENARLREFVAEYARHAVGCNAGVSPEYPCKCGYERELAALSPEQKEESDGK